MFSYVGDVHYAGPTDAAKAANAEVSKYLESLETPEGTIDLTEITPYNVFDICPVYIKSRLSIDYAHFSADDKEKVEERRKEMVEAMNIYLDGRLNIYAVSTVHSNSVKKSVDKGDIIHFKNGVYLINGEPVECEYGVDYEGFLYESYQGILGD